MPQTNYTAWWEKIESLVEKKGLYRDGLTEVMALYKKAKAEKAEAQQIKALVYRLELQEQLEEFSDTLAISSLSAETESTKGAANAILNALLAGYYQQYYNNHRWQLYDRTTTINFSKENIRSWGPADFHEAISKYYQLAMQDAGLLQSTSLESFEPILQKGNARPLRPTLFDLLSWKALEYFENDPVEIPKSADTYIMSDPNLLAPAQQFAGLRLSNTDSSSHLLQALKIYQQVLGFHLRQKNTAALADADLHRLEFVNENISVPNKDKLILQALERLEADFPETPASDMARFRRAEYFHTLPQPDNITALKICDQVTAGKRQNEGAANCYNLAQRIQSASLSITTERVNLPGESFRALVNWSNLPLTKLRLYKVENSLKKTLMERGGLFDSARWSRLRKEKPLREWEQQLPYSNDYREHNTEIKIESLPVGEYLLLASGDQKFELAASTMSATIFHVSNISYVNREQDYLILHRNTGEPLAKAAIQLWHNEYDYQTRTYRQFRGNSYTTNDHGYVKLTGGAEKSSRGFRLEITYGSDQLFLDRDEYNYVYRPGIDTETVKGDFEARNARVFFFTDRSIYRPGQSIHFKGIAVTKEAESKKSKIYAGKTGVVKLYNANGEEIDSIKLTTNEFGSYAGTFKLPETGLTGMFQLEDKLLHGEQNFHVEEYKRPKFSAEFEPIKGTYRVNDSVTVTGTARAYAGNLISNATVRYRVERRARFLYPWRFSRIAWHPGSSQEIAQGTLKTNNEGSFSIRFPAIPDEQIDRNTDPVFDYEVTADITDLNGETRSATTLVAVSYKALQLHIAPISKTMPVNEFNELLLSTKNMAGQFETSKVTVSMKPLLSPGRLVRARLWEEPDLYVMTEKEFISTFPFDEYRKESDPATWPTGSVIWQKTDSSNSGGKIAVNMKKVPTGWFQIEAQSIDRFGDTIVDKSIVYLYDPKDKQLPVHQYITTRLDKTTAQPGETASLTIGTSADKLFVFRQRENADEAGMPVVEKPFSQRFGLLQLKSGIINETIQVSDADRGGIGINYLFIKHNRFYATHTALAVPWKEKELNIQLQTWRDKTLPGSQEKWTVTISGLKGEKTAAELLTGMYDASLDQFAPHQWLKPSLWPEYAASTSWRGQNNFSRSTVWNESLAPSQVEVPVTEYDRLLGISGDIRSGMLRKTVTRNMKAEGAHADAAVAMAAPGEVLSETARAKPAEGNIAKNEEMELADMDQAATKQTSGSNAPAANIRKDFRETAFFLPQLMADDAGNYSFSFTMPEALTTWKWQLLAHNAQLATGLLSKEIITQKELMVQPNMPRFLREGDRMEFSTKIVNLSDKEMTGQAELQLIDATTNQPVDGWFRNFFPNQYFTVAPGGSEAVRFPVEVPYLFDKALTWRIIARSGNLTDGEESALPVLSNRQLVTESLPFYINGSGTKKYSLKKLAASKESETLSNHLLKVEFSSNPAWYAVQSLPYLADYPYECSEQTFNRLYANLLAAFIVDRLPKIRGIMKKWQTSDTSALLSNLQKNQELKQVLLEETPWVLAAKSETEQKKNIAQLFNLVQLATNREKLAGKLLEMQSPNGGFSWFSGGPDDRYITQYILTGIGHLKKLGAIPKDFTAFKSITAKALPYLDARLKEDYERRDKKAGTVSYLNYYAVQYHYMRSFFPETGIPGDILAAANHYRKEIRDNWIKGNRMAKGMTALALFRTGDALTARKIMASLAQTAINHEELGMYWKDLGRPYYWQDAPIESQALLIEAFTEITGQAKTAGALKLWLLRNKQTNHWQSTKATADACYALLLQGENWLANEPKVSIDLGGVTTVSASQAEAGTGYYSKTIAGTAVFPEMSEITLQAAYPGVSPAKMTSDMPVWGAVYWQYFENLDKITPAATPLKLSKQVMVERLTDKGPVLEPVNEGVPLKVGDKIVVRLEITTDRSMEYVHVKDMRASALEPVNVISGYRWQGSLGYYESTRDASTNFFIQYLPKGTNVMEYALFVSQAGIFSNGISTIQCMYAPEFTSHSEGIRIMVE